MIDNSFQKKFSYALLIEQCRINHNLMESSHIFIMCKCMTKELTENTIPRRLWFIIVTTDNYIHTIQENETIQNIPCILFPSPDGLRNNIKLYAF
jgi:hypothetical protein